nr:MAG TPA: hypothetical protein [Caudoviricetes sp.]
MSGREKHTGPSSRHVPHLFICIPCPAGLPRAISLRRAVLSRGAYSLR